nr:hypothetical protein [uncultured Acetatifactor sp.]
MEIKKLIHRKKPPCAECPYKLGLVYTLANPCPACRDKGYQTFERFWRLRMGLPERQDDAEA